MGPFSILQRKLQSAQVTFTSIFPLHIRVSRRSSSVIVYILAYADYHLGSHISCYAHSFRTYSAHANTTNCNAQCRPPLPLAYWLFLIDRWLCCRQTDVDKHGTSKAQILRLMGKPLHRAFSAPSSIPQLPPRIRCTSLSRFERISHKLEWSSANTKCDLWSEVLMN